MISARPQAQPDGRGVEQDPVSRTDRPDQRGISHGSGRFAGDLDHQLDGAGPLGQDLEHGAAAHAHPGSRHDGHYHRLPMHPLERLINLVALLLEARRPLTFEQIRSLMPAYQQDDVAAAKRMFERDKDTLREVGVPVELSSTDAWEVEQGYRIPKDQYYLPEVTFTPDEVWALFVAAHAPGQSGDAELAFQKLSTGTDANVLSAMA